MPKRYRAHRFKPGVLEVYWGVTKGDPTPDIIYHRGEGCAKPDGHLLYSFFGCKRERQDWQTGKTVFDQSLLEELEARGYDLTTLKFSIKKKTDQRAT